MRPGVQLPIDQNATGDKSEATPSEGQQKFNTSREENLKSMPVGYMENQRAHKMFKQPFLLTIERMH